MKLAKVSGVFAAGLVFLTFARTYALAAPALCGGGASVNTALGCVPVEMSTFIPWLMMYMSGIAGGIAFFTMAYGFILMATAGGDPKAFQGAKETVTSAITGLFVAVFAVFILRLIVVGILKLPGVN